MQDTKYFFEGIPLTQYCISHELNPNTIRTRIWKKRNNPKYENYTDQEIVDMVVKSCGTGIKYMYGEQTLRQYCLEKGLVFATIISRIKNLKMKNPNMSNDELVKKAIDEFENGNYTLFYDNMPLKDYCTLHPEINYNTIRAYIAREKERDNSKTTEELVDAYLAKEHFGIYKYYYCGIPLMHYCCEHNISYEAIKGRIYRYKVNNPGISDDEVVCAIMDEYEPFMPKYMYKGHTLNQYCLLNDLSYYSVVSYVKRRIAKNPNLIVDDLIDEGIRTIKRHGIIYYYGGVPLKDYALENGLNASSIRSSILRKKSKSTRALQDIVNECVETYKEFSVKYFYHGESLLSFCKRMNISYNTVIHKYLDFNDKTDDKDVTVAIEKIVDDMLKSPVKRTKYYYGDDSLAGFCRKNGYSYASIYSKLILFEKRYVYDTQEEAVFDATNEYIARKVKQVLTFFESVEQINIDVLDKICSFLKIDLDCLYDLKEMGFSYSQSLMMICWYGEKNEDLGNTFISDKMLEYVFNLIDNISDEKKIQNVNLRDLVALYKCNLVDTREKIIISFNGFIYNVIYNVCQEFNITCDSLLLNQLVQDVSLYILVAVDKTGYGTEEQISNNIELIVRSLLEKRIRKDKNICRLVKEF